MLDAIAREIRDEVLVRTLWLSPEAVQVDVAGGEVTLRVETRMEAELVRAFVQSVPGVVSVDSTLTWKGGRPTAAPSARGPEPSRHRGSASLRDRANG